MTLAMPARVPASLSHRTRPIYTRFRHRGGASAVFRLHRAHRAQRPRQHRPDGDVRICGSSARIHPLVRHRRQRLERRPPYRCSRSRIDGVGCRVLDSAARDEDTRWHRTRRTTSSGRVRRNRQERSSPPGLNAPGHRCHRFGARSFSRIPESNAGRLATLGIARRVDRQSR